MKTDAKRHSAPPPGLTKTDKKDNAALAAAIAKAPLAEGADSAAVGDLKHDLSVDGFKTSSGDAFDASTAKALEQFQTAVGRTTSGTLNKSTLSSLVSTETQVRKNPGELELGEKNSGVTKMEGQLTTLGYGVAPDAGVFSKSDADALSALRASDHVKGTGSTLGAAGKKELAADVQALNHEPYRNREAPSKKQTMLNTSTGKDVAQTNPNGTVGIGIGAKSDAVSNIQAHLEAAGYSTTGTKGNFGDRTRGAVEAFQRKSDLPVTGRVDPKTWAALQKSVISTKSTTSPPQSLLEKSSAVRSTQALLIEAGFGKHLKATGLFDTATETAVKAFQKKEKLPVTGEVNGATDKKLQTVAAKNGWSAGSWHKGPGTEYGADTSDYQSNSQFQQSIKGAQWSAIKATDGESANQASFKSRWAELGQRVASGKMKLRMAYCFMEPGDSGVAQAKKFLSTVGVHGKLPAGTRLALDWEQGAEADPGALTQASNYIHQVTGVWPVVYTNQGSANAAAAAAPHSPMWLANVADNAGDPLPVSLRDRNVPFFQYSWKPYDQDQFNGNLSSLEKFAGYT